MVLLSTLLSQQATQLLSKDTIKQLVEQQNILFNEKLPKMWMGVPLLLDEKLTLVLVFKEYTSENNLNEKDLELINAVSLPLTKAIEKKMIEEEKRDTLRKFEELNQTKDNFFQIISHDLRSPFDSILFSGFTEILKNDFEN